MLETFFGGEVIVVECVKLSKIVFPIQTGHYDPFHMEVAAKFMLALLPEGKEYL